ncbi:uncharacterized protein V6R79_006050 [Siganus canaliculatus]
MYHKILLIQLLLVHYSTQSQTQMVKNCDENVTMKCDGVHSDDITFLSLAWYKLTNIPNKKQGIVRRSNNDVSPQNFNYSRPAWFGRNHSLFLPNVMPEDSGNYECAINAKIGRQNQINIILLIVNNCSTTMMQDLNTTSINQTCREEEKDLPIMWSIVGYVAVGFAKIVLSVISIWAIRAFRIRSSRRRQHDW